VGSHVCLWSAISCSGLLAYFRFPWRQVRA
jgi:hypothetical protein